MVADLEGRPFDGDRHLYAALGVHDRSEAVERARVLTLLAPSSPTR